MSKAKRKAYRITWDAIENIDCVHLIGHGLHGHVIAKMTGLSVGQVYYRAKQMGFRLRDYRDGRGPIASTLVRNYTVHTMSRAHAKCLTNEIEPIIRSKLNEKKK